MRVARSRRRDSSTSVRTVLGRARFRSLIIAASVAYRQLGPTLERVDRPSPPHVLLLPTAADGLSTREVVGATILTESLDLAEAERARLIDNPN